MPALPTELVTEILARLTVKSLLKFKCVSKSWRALISSPEFVKTHLIVCAHQRVVLTEVRDLYSFHDVQYILKDYSLNTLRNDPVTEALDLYYPMYNPQQKVCVVGSINGLICLAIKDKDFVLWNPSMRLFRHLPLGVPCNLLSKFISSVSWSYKEESHVHH
ncbi:putative early light-induced protein, chloroplastic-like [Capsicum annuum]|uniref:F-box domain-containing protein n=1 Tax=Capsicum annuum TaxID=4072 RepID=A0A2G2ZV59_CAPAN|nr:putative early light-induced protein, chloroplastic-like [Capsicum annuum]KAF3664065.1 putative early light-induced protein, chloroplastic-like [Capsicum annuum]PHT85863.1 hypothetical protein T459_07969 [Capsicum annuum]